MNQETIARTGGKSKKRMSSSKDAKSLLGSAQAKEKDKKIPIEPVIIEINKPQLSNESGSSLGGSNIREESYEDSDDSDFSVGSDSSNERVVKLRDLDDDLTDMIAEAYEAARKFTSIQQTAEERLEQIDKQSQERFEKVRLETLESIDGRMQEHTNFVQNVQKDLEDEVRRRIREKSDQDMTLRHVEQKVEAIYKQLAGITGVLDSLTSLAQNHNETLSIAMQMGAQDEADRQSVALYGYKSSGLSSEECRTKGFQEKSLFTLNKQCLTCSGQASVVLNAFKIACLSYNAKPFTYEGQQISRQEMFEQENQRLQARWAEFEDLVTQSKQKLSKMHASLKLANPISFKSEQRPSNEDLFIQIVKPAEDRDKILPVKPYITTVQRSRSKKQLAPLGTAGLGASSVSTLNGVECRSARNSRAQTSYSLSRRK